MNKRLIAGALALALTGAVRAQLANGEAAAMAAAMKRAEMLAAGPKRVILEAAKVRRRDGGAASPEAGSAGRAARPARLQSLHLAAAAMPDPMPPLQREQAPLDVAALLAAAQEPVAVRKPAATGQPRLVWTVEPEIPESMRQQPGRVHAVQADLTLRADGSVAEVALLPPVPRIWQRYLREALLQWRFEPLQAGWVHRVQLVFQEP